MSHDTERVVISVHAAVLPPQKSSLSLFIIETIDL